MSYSWGCRWSVVIAIGSIGIAAISPKACAADAPETPSEKPRLLVRGDPAGPLLSRIEAELSAQGFDVVETALSDSDDDSVSTLREAGAVASIRITIRGTSIELKINDTAHAQAFVRFMDIDPDLAVTAVRAVEIIRAHLINLLALVPAMPPAPPAPPAPPPKPVTELPPASYSGLSVGIATTTGSFRAAAGSMINTGVRIRIRDAFFADVWGYVPVVPASFASDVGSAELSMGMVGAGISWQGIGDRHWRADIGVGASLAFVRVQGAPAIAGLTGKSDASLAFLPTIRVGLSVPLAPDWAVRADCAAGFALPDRTVVYAVQQYMGSWGPPVVVAGLSLERIWR